MCNVSLASKKSARGALLNKGCVHAILCNNDNTNNTLISLYLDFVIPREASGGEIKKQDINSSP